LYILSNDRIKGEGTFNMVSYHCGEESYQVASHMHTTLYGLVSNEYPSSYVTHSQSFPKFPHALHSLSTRLGVTGLDYWSHPKWCKNAFYSLFQRRREANHVCSPTSCYICSLSLLSQLYGSQ